MICQNQKNLFKIRKLILDILQYKNFQKKNFFWNLKIDLNQIKKMKICPLPTMIFYQKLQETDFARFWIF